MIPRTKLEGSHGIKKLKAVITFAATIWAIPVLFLKLDVIQMWTAGIIQMLHQVANTSFTDTRSNLTA